MSARARGGEQVLGSRILYTNSTKTRHLFNMCCRYFSRKAYYKLSLQQQAPDPQGTIVRFAKPSAQPLTAASNLQTPNPGLRCDPQGRG